MWYGLGWRNPASTSWSGKYPHYLEGFNHPRWLFGISSINSISSIIPPEKNCTQIGPASLTFLDYLRWLSQRSTRLQCLWSPWEQVSHPCAPSLRHLCRPNFLGCWDFWSKFQDGWAYDIPGPRRPKAWQQKKSVNLENENPSQLCCHPWPNTDAFSGVGLRDEVKPSKNGWCSAKSWKNPFGFFFGHA